MGIEAAAWHLAVTPEMVWSAMGTSQKVDTRHALLCLLHSLQVGGDLTVQQYQELGLGEEEQFWEERSNQELLEGQAAQGRAGGRSLPGKQSTVDGLLHPSLEGPGSPMVG